MPWIRRQLVADRYGTRRVFIAGDAAHLTSPTGGFGMNTGIQDSVDLAWKLEACLRGWGGTELLASYETERRPVGIRNVTEATGNLKRMLTPRAQHPAAEIFRPGPEGDRARFEFGRNFTQMMRREWFTLGIHLGYSYEGSPIIVPDGTSALPDEVSTYTQTSRPGSRAPHVWLREGESTLDLFGRGFVLLRFGAKPPAADRIVDAARQRGVPLSVVDIDHEEANRDLREAAGAGATGRAFGLAGRAATAGCAGSGGYGARGEGAVIAFQAEYSGIKAIACCRGVARCARESYFPHG